VAILDAMDQEHGKPKPRGNGMGKTGPGSGVLDTGAPIASERGDA
jgi:hypothetical protein